MKKLLPVKYFLLPSLKGRARGEGLIFYFSLFIFSLLFFSCSKAEPLYDTWPARFVVQNANNIPVLNSALGGMGEFCTAVRQGTTVTYTNLKTSHQVNLTASEVNYGNFNFGRVGGFIVGHTSMISSRFPNQVVCYDMVCSNCYEDLSVSRALNLLSGARAQCAKCQRIYDLNELGMVISEGGGRSLFRYSVSYNSYQLIIGR